LITDAGEIEYPVISVEHGQIVRIEAGDANGSTETLTAAFFDIHVHGARSFDFMASDAAGIAEVGRFLVTRGVANYLPTTVTAPLDLTLKALERLADAIEHPGGRRAGCGAGGDSSGRAVRIARKARSASRGQHSRAER
jgi:N-acetylglucosamine-6-phosphate deacetylase